MTTSRRSRGKRGRSIGQSLREYGRGVAGGLIFSLPLLYTMEVWWLGFTSHPWRLLGYVAGTFCLLLGYNRFAGLRSDAGWGEVMIDSVEEMGIGVIVASGVLWGLGQIGAATEISEMIGKIMVEAMAIAIGVSVGTAQLGGEEDGDSGMDGDDPLDSPDEEVSFIAQMVVAFCGAILFAMNIAPTEEILLIASDMTGARMIAMALASMFMIVVILYYLQFIGWRRHVRSDGAATVIAGSVIMYAVALISSAVMLWLFGHFDGMGMITCLAKTVVLGVAASLGASAGRLLLQSRD